VAPPRTLPTFLIIGAEKSGTTALADALNRHGSIYLPKAKELRFFSSHNWGRGPDWYSAQFQPEPGVTCIGEASPSYSLFPVEPNVVARMHATLGHDVRLVYLVRDPVERLVSHYLHAITYGWVPSGMAVDRAVEQAPLLVAASMYHTQLQRYLDQYPLDAVRVVVFEDVVATGVVPGDLLEFLGASPSPLALDPANVTTDRGGLPSRLARLKPMARDALPQWARTPVRHMSTRLERPLPDRGDVRAQVRGLDLHALLRREAAGLSSLIGADLVHRWGLDER
jgi:hypothetical protein